MRDFRIYRPALEKPYPHAKGEYASQMMQHLQDTEDWFKMMNTEGGDRPAMCQLWTMEHHDVGTLQQIFLRHLLDIGRRVCMD